MMSRASRRLRSQAGITPTEILVVVALIASAVLATAPFLRTFVRRSRLDSTAREIEMTMLSARLQAVKRGTNIGVWLSTNPSQQAYRRLIVFEDTNGNGILDAGEIIDQTINLPPETEMIQLRIDNYDTQNPKTTPGNYNVAFSFFGTALVSGASGTTLAVFVLDNGGNVIQVGVPTAITGRVAMTKLDQSATSAPYYVSTPWKWY